MKNAALDEDIVLKSKGEQLFSYTYIQDIVSGIFTILKKEFYFIFFLFSFLCAEPLLLQGLFSSCGDWGLLWLCSGFSLRWLLLLQSTTWGVGHRP